MANLFNLPTLAKKICPEIINFEEQDRSYQFLSEAELQAESTGKGIKKDEMN